MTYGHQPQVDSDAVTIKFWLRLGTRVGIGIALLIALAMYGCPQYAVYSKNLSGKAAFAEAEQNRRIKVTEAQALYDSAKLTAQAEVERAKGTNEANRIMAQNLGGPENYLRWSYIHMLEETAGKGGREIIYVPANGLLPVTEAGRAVAPRQAPAQE